MRDAGCVVRKMRLCGIRGRGTHPTSPDSQLLPRRSGCRCLAAAGAARSRRRRGPLLQRQRVQRRGRHNGTADNLQ